MSASLNRVQLIGNLGKDPEVRRMTNGDPVVTLSIATSERWKDKSSGEQKEKTEWHRVVIFNSALAKVAEDYLTKGSKVYVEGQIQTRKWTDKGNVERYTTEIVLPAFNAKLVLLSARSEGDGREPGDDQQKRTREEDLDDSIPF